MTARLILAAVLGLGAIGAVLVTIQYFRFRTNANQLAILRGYYPEVGCAGAGFAPIAVDDESPRSLYVFRVEGAGCMAELKAALVRRDYRLGTDRRTRGSLVHRDAATGETVSFRFAPGAGSAIWSRDRR